MTFVLLVFISVVFLILASTCLSSLDCRTCRTNLFVKNLTLLSATVIGWCIILYYFNPNHKEHTFLISSTGAPHIWGENVRFVPSQVYRPTSLQELQTFVRDSTKCRVVGGGHSFSPLVETREDLIDIRALRGIIADNGTHITAWAGSTVEEVQIYLTQRGRTLHGFGSIHSQTLAGGLSTSLVGIQPMGFASQCTWAQTIDAVGALHEWDDTYFLRNSMGLLGVITQLQFETHTNAWTTHTVKHVHLDTLFDSFQADEATAVDSATTMEKIRTGVKVVATMNTAQNIVKPTEYPKYWTQNDYIIYDLLISPLALFFPYLHHFMLDMSINPRDTETALLGFDMKQFGQTYTDYVIPLQNCTIALQEMAGVSRYDTLVRIKYLSEYNSSCLDVTQTPSCRIEAYAGQHNSGIYEDIEKYQAISVKYNGFVHWGKLYMGNVTQQMRRFECYPQFRALQLHNDPTGKFVNEYLSGRPAKYTAYSVTHVYVYVAVAISSIFIMNVIAFGDIKHTYLK